MKRVKWASIAVVGIAAVAIWFGVHSVVAITAGLQAVSAPVSGPTILIDAGHGGFDGGAVGVGGLVEKDLNLAVAQKLYDLFAANGFSVVMTREEDVSLEDGGLSTLRKRKNSDLHNRMEQAKSLDNCILLSIHQNKFPQASSFGAQVFYGPKDPESKRMGEILQAQMISMLQPENTRQAKPCTDSVYLIYNAPMPALLIECGFLSNAEDVQRLTDQDYQKRIAFSIFAAVCESLELQRPAASGTEKTAL